MRTLSALAFLMFAAGCGTTTTERLGLPPPSTVERVDLQRYLGTWYEIAAFPQRFQKGCTASTATYSKGDGDQLQVLNQCRLETVDGKLKEARGVARVVDPVSNAKLEVSFFRPFWGDYWIVDLGADYDYAVVGHPSRDYLWILSRSPQMPPELYDAILQRLQAQGFETQRLRRTVR